MKFLTVPINESIGTSPGYMVAEKLMYDLFAARGDATGSSTCPCHPYPVPQLRNCFSNIVLYWTQVDFHDVDHRCQ